MDRAFFRIGYRILYEGHHALLEASLVRNDRFWHIVAVILLKVICKFDLNMFLVGPPQTEHLGL